MGLPSWSTAGGIDWTVPQSPPSPASDAAAEDVLLKAGDAYSQAATNVTGGDFVLAGGLGQADYTVSDYSLLSGAIATITVNGVATLLTEGVDWTAATDNATTATSLASAVDGVSGVSATSQGAVVYLTPDEATYALIVATDDSTNLPVTQGAAGTTLVQGLLTSVSAHTVNFSVFAVNSGVIHTNRGASGTIVGQLPETPIQGENHVFLRIATQAFQIEPGASNAFLLSDGTTTTNGKYRSLDSDGAVLAVVWDGTNWLVDERGTLSQEA